MDDAAGGAAGEAGVDAAAAVGDAAADRERLVDEADADLNVEYENGDEDGVEFTGPGLDDDEVEDDGSAWQFGRATPSLACDVPANKFGAYGREEHEELVGKFCSRFQVDEVAQITLDMLLRELDPHLGTFGRTMFDLIAADQKGKEVDVTIYWEFVMRRLRLMALGVSSSMTEHPVMGKVYKPVVDGRLTDKQYQLLLKNIESRCVGLGGWWCNVRARSPTVSSASLVARVVLSRACMTPLPSTQVPPCSDRQAPVAAGRGVVQLVRQYVSYSGTEYLRHRRRQVPLRVAVATRDWP